MPVPVVMNTDSVVARDGTALAMNVFVPQDEHTQWPALVTYIPYLKDGWAGARYDKYLRFLAQQGYAVVHADFRGMGCSGGVKREAFEARESDDVYDLIEGVAAKAWCNGVIGMWGHSYGGITSLKAAAATPPHLRAIVAIEGSTDPYLGEVMRYGASVMGTISAEWSTWMLAMAALPPLNDEVHQSIWDQHLDALTPWQLPWREHPLKDGYWGKREIDPAQITVPSMFIISSRDPNPWAWHDFAQVQAPKRVICGPWQHGLPEEADRERIDSIGEMVKWWDRWLKGAPEPSKGAEPEKCIYVLGAGAWETRAELPDSGETITYHLGAGGRLTRHASASPAVATVPIDYTVGSTTGFGGSVYPTEQFEDDARCLLFDGDREADALQIYGSPRLAIRTAQTDVGGLLCARLVDVAPDGTAQLVSKGATRLLATSDTGQDQPSTREVTIELYPVRYQLGSGNFLRVALAHADFPELWPEPPEEAVRVELDPECSTLSVPIVASIGPAFQFAAPREELVTQPTRETVTHHVVTRSAPDVIEINGGFTSDHDSVSGQHKLSCTHSYRMVADCADPEKTALTTTTTLTVADVHDGNRVVVDASTEEANSHFAAEMRVADKDRVIAQRSWAAGPRVMGKSTEPR